MRDLKIRGATESDVATLLYFVKELARYEKAEQEVIADEEALRASLFGDSPYAYGLIAEQDGKAVGIAIYFFNFSTWQGRPGLYLEDAYVAPKYRGLGIGRALLQRLARIAVEKDCRRFEWSVLDWNTPSIEFYEKLGASPKNEWILYRVTGEQLQRLAEST